jgi:ubiquinone/menaquinone biosynthesis C-methylase UbiE
MNLSLFEYDEFRYYAFGLNAGVSNLLTNGLTLGGKKTLGKITQPVNSYTRFPEYYYFEKAIREYLSTIPPGRRIRILDVGSPKMLGLYLASTIPCEVTLTDISELNVDEYRAMWRGLEPKAIGGADFLLQDARSLQFDDAEFDVVYSMSVIEHIEGDSGDSKAARELLRVLKPGGLVILSVPFGTKYIEQQRIGFSGAARRMANQQAYFFQRIYDLPAFESRILSQLRSLDQTSFVTTWRTHKWLTSGFGALSENLRGLLGFCNPFLSALANRSDVGISNGFDVEYGAFHEARDLYGDLIMMGRKPG